MAEARWPTRSARTTRGSATDAGTPDARRVRRGRVDGRGRALRVRVGRGERSLPRRRGCEARGAARRRRLGEGSARCLTSTTSRSTRRAKSRHDADVSTRGSSSSTSSSRYGPSPTWCSTGAGSGRGSATERMKIERFLVALTVANLVVLVLDLVYIVIAGWLPGL